MVKKCLVCLNICSKPIYWCTKVVFKNAVLLFQKNKFTKSKSDHFSRVLDTFCEIVVVPVVKKSNPRGRSIWGVLVVASWSCSCSCFCSTTTTRKSRPGTQPGGGRCCCCCLVVIVLIDVLVVVVVLVVLSF